MDNVSVEKNQNENTSSLMRRFTKRVQGSGVLPRARSQRFYERPRSRTVQKQKALKKIERRQTYRELAKLGRAPQKPTRRR